MIQRIKRAGGACYRAVRVNTRLIGVGVLIYGVGFLVGAGLGAWTGFIDASSVPGVTPLSAREVEISLQALLVRNVPSILLLALGAASFGTITVLFGFQNGLVHGMLLGTVFVELGGVVRVVTLFVPHAIFELPAIFLGIAAGLLLPRQFLGFLRDQRQTPLTVADGRQFLCLLACSQLLVVVSAVVEYYVTLSFV